MIYPISPHALVHTPLPVKRKIKLPGRGACFSKSFLRFENVTVTLSFQAPLILEMKYSETGGSLISRAVVYSSLRFACARKEEIIQ